VLVSSVSIKLVFLTIVNRGRLGMGPRRDVSIDRVFDPVEFVSRQDMCARLHLLNVDL